MCMDGECCASNAHRAKQTDGHGGSSELLGAAATHARSHGIHTAHGDTYATSRRFYKTAVAATAAYIFARRT